MKRIAPLVFCFALFLSLWDSALTEVETAEISAKVLRLHVRASDDTPAAQGRKLLVRDVLGETLAPLLSGAADRNEAARRAESALPDLQRQAEEVLAFLGEPEPVRLSLRLEDFPERSYPGVTLPAGEYLALRADLGDGAGANWWCVVWPPLCLAASEEEEEEAMDVFSPGERKLLTSPGICFRFRFLELLKRIFGSGG